MNGIGSQVALQGWIRLRVFKAADRRIVHDTGWFRNLITNGGLNAIATQADVMTHYHVGNSSTAPTENDTWVGSWVATTSQTINEVTGAQGTAPYYGFRRQTKQFPPGAAAGNLSEVAVGWSATTGTAFSHELIRDGVGNPTTITVLADEFLDFTYELRYIVPVADVVGTTSISGVPYNFTTRALSATGSFWWGLFVGKQFVQSITSETEHRAYTGDLAAITASQPLGSDAIGTLSVTAGGYINDSHFRNFTVSADPTQWNVSGGIIRSLVLSCRGNRWQTSFAKVSDGTGIGKTAGNTLTINWRVSWARAA